MEWHERSAMHQEEAMTTKQSPAAYRRRRDFAKTAEPKGGTGSEKAAERPRFVVQIHDATGTGNVRRGS